MYRLPTTAGMGGEHAKRVERRSDCATSEGRIICRHAYRPYRRSLRRCDRESCVVRWYGRTKPSTRPGWPVCVVSSEVAHLVAPVARASSLKGLWDRGRGATSMELPGEPAWSLEEILWDPSTLVRPKSERPSARRRRRPAGVYRRRKVYLTSASPCPCPVGCVHAGSVTTRSGAPAPAAPAPIGPNVSARREERQRPRPCATRPTPARCPAAPPSGPPFRPTASVRGCVRNTFARRASSARTVRPHAWLRYACPFGLF